MKSQGVNRAVAFNSLPCRRARKIRCSHIMDSRNINVRICWPPRAGSFGNSYDPQMLLLGIINSSPCFVHVESTRSREVTSADFKQRRGLDSANVKPPCRSPLACCSPKCRSPSDTPFAGVPFCQTPLHCSQALSRLPGPKRSPFPAELGGPPLARMALRHVDVLPSWAVNRSYLELAWPPRPGDPGFADYMAAVRERLQAMEGSSEEEEEEEEMVVDASFDPTDVGGGVRMPSPSPTPSPSKSSSSTTAGSPSPSKAPSSTTAGSPSPSKAPSSTRCLASWFFLAHRVVCSVMAVAIFTSQHPCCS